MRNRQLVRQVVILRELIRAGRVGRTLESLAITTDVTTRTIRRDIEALESAHLPVLVGKRGEDSVTVYGLTYGAGCPVCGRTEHVKGMR